jgi:thiamine-monophosphate kinase
VTNETTFIGLMRAMAGHPGARGLLDDTAVIDMGDQSLILTHDMMAEGVHWRSEADPADVAWKLLAANLSDLAAKGAWPVGVLLGFMLGDDAWDRRFAEGLATVLQRFSVPLLGGDTVGNRGDKRAIGMTAIGTATHRPVPARSGAQPGDVVYVTGTLGNALAGYELVEAGFGEGPLVDAYNRPLPRLVEGQALAPYVHAMMDISDGLLLDAERMALASKSGISIELQSVPLSDDYIALRGDGSESRLQAASWGDDYELLFTAPLETELPVRAIAVGKVVGEPGLHLTDVGNPIPLPASLGYQHQ